jgi:DNA-binding response OmpR family regulator
MTIIDLTETFRIAGFEVTLAANLSVGRFQAEKFGHYLSAALLDLGLPDGPGDLLVDEISAVLPDLPIILVTGQPADSIQSNAFRSGRVALLSKPYRSSDALALVLSKLGRPGLPRPATQCGG